MKREVLQIDERDNIAVALTSLNAGTRVNIGGRELALSTAVPGKHKFALRNFEPGEEIVMYGVCVGRATRPIPRGSAISTENTVHAVEEYGEPEGNANWRAPDSSSFNTRNFNGYRREDGKVGTENNWLIIPLVFCENRNMDILEEALTEPLGYGNKKGFVVETAKLVSQYRAGASTEELRHTAIVTSREKGRENRVFPNVDGIRFLRHEGGCGGSPSDSATLCRLLAGYIMNPNVAGATVLSLGCQHAQISLLQQALREFDP